MLLVLLVSPANYQAATEKPGVKHGNAWYIYNDVVLHDIFSA